MVLEKKHLNTEEKYRHMKQQLNKKFKREKEMGERAKQQREVKAYDDEQRHEKQVLNKERKQTQD